MDMSMFMDDDAPAPRASPAAVAGATSRNETRKKGKQAPAGKSAAAKEKKKKAPAGRSAAAKLRQCQKRGCPASSAIQAAKPPVRAAKAPVPVRSANRPGKTAHLAKSPVLTRRRGGNAVSYGSDCSGMGTDSVAMRRIFGSGGARHVFASDVEASARYVIRSNYRPERLYKNMRDRKRLRRGEVDVYTAGLLCRLTCQT